MYPRLLIDTKKYAHNIKVMKQLCDDNHVTIMAVTKVYCAEQPLVDVVNDSGVDYIADSRLINLKNMDTSLPKVLLRIPSIHEADEVVRHASISLNSEIATITALDKAARQNKQSHDIILMIDIGDLREGIFYKENIVNAVREIQHLSHINLIGMGTNLTCYGGIIPNEKTLTKLIDIIDLIHQMLGIDFQIISGGNSSHIHLLQKHQNLPKVNNVRLGESLILGRETAYGHAIDNMHQDVVLLQVDLIEVKAKPSIPEGDIGMNAFGQTPSFQDYGLMKRGILAIGKQDVDYHELIPLDNQIRLVGSSSDHIIVDLTHTDKNYEIGDVITFKLSYGSLLSLMTSKYVEKKYV